MMPNPAPPRIKTVNRITGPFLCLAEGTLAALGRGGGTPSVLPVIAAAIRGFMTIGGRVPRLVCAAFDINGAKGGAAPDSSAGTKIAGSPFMATGDTVSPAGRGMAGGGALFAGPWASGGAMTGKGTPDGFSTRAGGGTDGGSPAGAGRMFIFTFTAAASCTGGWACGTAATATGGGGVGGGVASCGFFSGAGGVVSAAANARGAGNGTAEGL